jgi:tRNA-specific 2-thiouridylase
MLTQRELSRTLLPIGHLEKEETRRLAAELGFCVAAKPDSQEICFVEDGDYAKFVTTRAPQMAIAGEIVDSEGTKLGEHHGLAHYTVGQRKGLGIAAPAPLYVTKIDVEANRVVVGPREALGVQTLEARDAKWAFAPVEAGARVGAQLRAHGEAAPATITDADAHGFALSFDDPYSGVSPGQMCVLYRDNEVLGAGTIR